jgi:hypothetical protein
MALHKSHHSFSAPSFPSTPFLVLIAWMPDSLSALIRDSFSLSTWVALVAACQYVTLTLVPVRLAIAPSLILIAFRLTHALLEWSEVTGPRSSDSVRFGRWTTKLSSRDGTASEKPGGSRVAVLVLAVRVHQYAIPMCYSPSGTKREMSL